MMDVHQLPEMGIGGILLWIVHRQSALEARIDALMHALKIPAPKKSRNWRNTLLAAFVFASVMLASGCGRLQPVTP